MGFSLVFLRKQSVSDGCQVIEHQDIAQISTVIQGIPSVTGKNQYRDRAGGLRGLKIP
jgi:hypothetical protein